jgi:hypothetical protein
VEAAQASGKAKAEAAQDLASSRTAIMDSAIQLRTYATKLIAGNDNSPNFEQQAAANTARLEKMLSVAPTILEVDRGQMSVAANQVEVGTNQIEVARSQYASGLNQIIRVAAPVAAGVQSACTSPQAPRLTAQCNEAKSAITAFQAAVQHGQAAFGPFKHQVQAELDKQASLIHQIDD